MTIGALSSTLSPIGGEDRRQLRRLGAGNVAHFALLPSPLGEIVLSVAAGREVTSKAHRYRAGHYLSEAGHPIRELDSSVPERPAASAKGTVNPSDMPMTMSRTASLEAK
jgi:hypothetical protein